MLRGLFAVYITLSSLTSSNSQELPLINKLNSVYQFDHNLFLIESTTITDRFINSPGSIECNSYVPQTLYVINGIQDDIRLDPITSSKNTLMIIALKSNLFEENLKFLGKVKEFQRDNINLKIGLFFTQSLTSSGNLLELFQWLWQHSIISIFVGVPAEGASEVGLSENGLNTYTFNPFGTFELINLTDNDSVEKYFPRICYDLRQHSIRIALHENINSFIYSKNNPSFGGPDGKLWQAIFHAINASYTLAKFVIITDGSDIQRMAVNGTIDLGPQPGMVSRDKPINLYPMYADTVTIIVPSALPYSEFTAYLKILTGGKVLSILLLTISVLTILLTFIRFIKRNRMSFFQSATDVVNLILYDDMAIDYRNLFRVEAFIILPLTMAGFVLINVISSILTSHLTRPMDQPEINTFADIERSPFPVMVPTKENMQHFLLQLKTGWNIDWRHKMSSTTKEEFYRQILSFNTTMCFVYSGSKFKNLLEHQKRLNIRGFRIPKQVITQQSVFGYIVPVDYPLKDCLNEVIHRISNAGLYWKWTDESYFEFVKNGYFPKTHMNDIDHKSEKYLLIIIAYGWIGSILVFSGEVVWNRIKISRFWKRLKINMRFSK